MARRPLQGNSLLSQSNLPKIGESWEIDIKGKWTGADGKIIKTFTGCQYSLSAIDLASGFIHGQLLKSRQNLHIYIKKLHNFVKSHNRVIKIIRTDNEFLTQNISEYCQHEDNKINLQTCIPYEHGQIGNIERFHRTLQDAVVKSLANKSHITERFWGMAYNDVIFKLNLQPQIFNNNNNNNNNNNQSSDCKNNITTAYKLWHNKDFNIINNPILPFGAIVAAHIPTDLQTALSELGSSITQPMDNVILADYTPISDTIHHPYSIEQEEIKNNNIISNYKIIMNNINIDKKII